MKNQTTLLNILLKSKICFPNIHVLNISLLMIMLSFHFGDIFTFPVLEYTSYTCLSIFWISRLGAPIIFFWISNLCSCHRSMNLYSFSCFQYYILHCLKYTFWYLVQLVRPINTIYFASPMTKRIIASIYYHSVCK